MIEAFVQGLLQLFTWPTFGFMLVGMAIGFTVGILPGLGGAVTIALMLPFTFAMSPLNAIAFLIGILAVNETTGDITSILFGVPGEATTAATIVDGHPMAKQGEAGRALGAALAASLQGALIGAFALALMIPVVRPIVLAFGSPEFFMMTVLGVTFVAALSGGAMLKGLIAGGVGFLLSMIRLDPQTGVQRATFGFLPLWDGIGLIPVTIGLFAIPELIDLAVRGTGIAGASGPTHLGGVMRGIGDTFRHGWLMLRCSLIGTVIGIMPGLGGSVAQWIAYAHAVQSSPNRERFGKGAVEGVIGPASANNSKDGGDLVPTVAFGVPGSVSTAILLGAFLIHGLVPGPPMLTDQLPLVFTMVWTLVVANVITVAICLVFLKQLVKITYVRGSYVIPFVLFLVFFGAYADKNQLFDVVLVLIFGGLGWLMVQTNWPRPPMILGLVLGALTERYLFLSVNRYEGEWLTRPMVLAFFVCIAAVLVYSIRQELRGRAEARAVRVASDP